MKLRPKDCVIRSVDKNLALKSERLAYDVFLSSEGEESASLVRNLIREIREKKYYVPELDVVMVDSKDEVYGHVMFSRFHIEGKYEKEMLLLSPSRSRPSSTATYLERFD